MEEPLEYIPKKIYHGKINKITDMNRVKGGHLVCVNGDIGDEMNTPTIVADMSYNIHGQLQINTAITGFPIYASEMSHWAPGKKVKITVEIVD